MEIKAWEYKGRKAEMTVGPTNFGIANVMKDRKAIEIAYRPDALGVVLREQMGLRPVV